MENDKLKKIATTDRPSGWMDLPAYKQENRNWMKRSADISLRVLDVLDEKDMTQTELAQLMNVSRQYVSRILRGSENLTLETISKLEDVLGVTLINVVDEEPTATADVERKTLTVATQPKVRVAIDERRRREDDNKNKEISVSGLQTSNRNKIVGYDKIIELSKSKATETGSSFVKLPLETEHVFYDERTPRFVKHGFFIRDAGIRRETKALSVELTSGQKIFGLVIPHLANRNRETNQYESSKVFNG